MRKKARRNSKNKAMGRIIVKRMTRDKKNKYKKKIMRKTKMRNNYKQIQSLKIIINKRTVRSL